MQDTDQEEINQQRVSLPERQPLEVMAAPVNAQMTENQSAKQLSSPCLPSCTQLKAVAPIAQRGAITQKMASCVSLLAPHQQTISMPRLRLAAAITHPRQKANMFLVTQVHPSNDLAGISPNEYQVLRRVGTRAMRMKEQAQMAALLPMLKMSIQRVLRMLERAKKSWALRFQRFFTRLQTLTTASDVQITAQMRKNIPGGVMKRWYLSDTSPVFSPITQLITTVATKRAKLPILICQDHLPCTPSSNSSSPCSPNLIPSFPSV